MGQHAKCYTEQKMVISKKNNNKSHMPTQNTWLILAINLLKNGVKMLIIYPKFFISLVQLLAYWFHTVFVCLRVRGIAAFFFLWPYEFLCSFFLSLSVPTIIIAHEFFDALPVHQFQVSRVTFCCSGIFNGCCDFC